MSAKNARIMTRDEVREAIIEEATPIDFESLIAAGAVQKDGAWYRILNKDAMPKHALSKIKTIQDSPQKGVRVKFRPVSRRAISLAKKLAPR